MAHPKSKKYDTSEIEANKAKNKEHGSIKLKAIAFGLRETS